MELAVAQGAEIAYATGLYVLLLVAPAIVTLLKGQRLVFFVGLLTLGMVWIVACFRLARPESWWARRFYGPSKRRRTAARYGTADQGP